MISSFHSIRFRLTVFYIGIFFIILLLISCVILWNYHEYVLTKGKSTLRDKSFVLGAWIDFSNPDFNHQSENYVHSQESAITVRLFDRKGTLLGQSNNFPDHVSLPVEVMRQIHTYDEPVIYETDDSRFVVAVNNLYSNEQIRGFVQIVQAKQSMLESFWYLFKIMTICILAALLLAFLGGMYMVNQMLAPLNRIIFTVNEIQAEKLASERLPVSNPNDEIGRLSITINSLLDRIEKAILLQRKFLSDAAHELRTPLTILKGNTEVAMMKEDSNKQTLSKNLVEINHLISLTNDLLMIARYDNHSLKLLKHKMDLSLKLKEALQSFDQRLEEKQIKLVSTISEDIFIEADATLIKRTIYNILDNSIKYIGNGKQIQVTLFKVKDGTVKLSIRDDGIGIPKDKLPTIFDRFYRVQEDRNKDIEGTGLGLSIVKSIMDLHGFKITVESEINRGTIFIILFN